MSKKEVALITNILTPYRMISYDHLYEAFANLGYTFKVYIMSEGESDRKWSYDDYKRQYTELLERIWSKGSFHINVIRDKQLFFEDKVLIILAGGYIYPVNWQIKNNAEKRNIPVVFWSESNLEGKDSYTSKIKMVARERVRHRFYKSIKAFLFAGKLSAQFIRKYNSEAKLIPYYNMVDREFFDNERYIDKENDKFTFILPARLVPDKGICEFVDLIEDDLASQFQVVCVGEGPLKDTICEKMRRKKMNLKLCGYKDQHEMKILYQSADAFLLPSLKDPNPLSCIEALWSGLPLFISSHVGNAPEVVVEGQNGYVFSYEQSHEANEKLRKLVTSGKQWREQAFGVSKRIACNLYDPEDITKKMIDSLRELHML